MPKKAKELSALEVKRLTKPGRHAVGGVPGLLLNVSENRARSWVLRFTIRGERRSHGLGGFPEVSLAEARQLARDAKEQVKRGVDPIEERKLAREALKQEQRRSLTFREAFERYDADRLQGVLGNERHLKQWRSTIKQYALPKIGDKSVDDISVEDILNVLKPIWTERTDTASRLRGRLESILDWARVSGYRSGENPARWRGNLDHLLPSPSQLKQTRGQPALAIADLPHWFRLLREREGLAARALEFLVFTAARSGEVRGATWDEIDLDAGVWTLPAERMKAKREHRVPLSGSAIAVLKALPRQQGVDYVFPAPQGGRMSDMAISAVMRRMQSDEIKAGRAGFLDPRSKRPAVPHGLRSTFRDWVAEHTSYPRELGEMALAHVVGTAVERAYLRSDMIEKRREMMEDWAAFVVSARQTA